ncbi:hypothetical protein V8G54_023080 [Vigna mungo]|uniref:Transposase n=1 Tax=Vigna mungo TaxID=3915 RepID=A0AAQ3RNU0_VIGMU
MAAYEDNCPVPLSNYSAWEALCYYCVTELFYYLTAIKLWNLIVLKNGAIGDTIRCPCPKCGFMKWHNRVEVEEHLILKQFPKNYVIWNLHGEKQTKDIPRNEDDIQETFHSENPMETMINEAFEHYRQRQEGTNIGSSQPVGVNNVLNERPRENHNEFNEFLNDGNQILYDGTKYTKLEFVVKLYHIKVLCRLSDKAMTMILDLLRDAFSEAKLPLSFYEAKKIINKLGLNYTKIDACPNDCMLYLRDDEKDLETCKHCGTSRWNPKKKKKQPAKVLRYFPLKPRLQRLFMCSKTAKHMRWHSLDNKDGFIRHPRDGEAWKTFDLMHPEFSSNPRNVRLGLTSDGFNPFGTMSSTYSIWPVFLIPYNLPPWICMKHTSLILSMIIPGKQMPGNNIDVYLQPLVDELRELWNDGVDTFDSSLNETFRMRAALMWTISDFLGLGILSGWNTHIGLACPTCNFDAEPCRLPHSRKWCFMGHRCFLSRNHRFRLNRVRFDGSTEEWNPPLKLSGSDIFRQVENINVTFGRGIHLDGRGKRYREEVKQWKKRSIFFELPYWESNLLRHNLDFMHIEKNVFDNIMYTLLNEKPKSKDNLNARKDLKEMGIRQDLWPHDNGRYHLALFSLTRDTKKLFLKTLKNVLVPDGYSSNVSRCVDEVQHKILGLKSHDCHIIMEQLLPLAIRNLLPNHVTATLVEFCSFFKVLCSKSLNIQELEKLQDRIVVTLCHLEMLFPPSFFTVMVHLTVHLVEEAKLRGPVHYRYMYPIERELGHLKTFVRNKAQPEGSIAEGYLAEESLTFCSRYMLDQTETSTHVGCESSLPTENTKQTETSTKQVGRQSLSYWTVDAIGVIKKIKVKVKEVNNLPSGERIIVEFDEIGMPIGEGQGVLAGYCGLLATDGNLFPINFERIAEANAQRYCKLTLGRKWAAHRQNLWNEFYDPAKTKDQIISNVSTVVESYILKLIKKKDGSFVNDAAKDIAEQIEAGLTQSTTNESEVSPNDVVGKVLGPEHSGRVRCMGLGAAPTNAFRNTRLRISDLSLASSTTEGGDANEPKSSLGGKIGSSGASNI